MVSEINAQCCQTDMLAVFEWRKISDYEIVYSLLSHFMLLSTYNVYRKKTGKIFQNVSKGDFWMVEFAIDFIFPSVLSLH